jgi:hypothetical protein
MKLKSAMQSLLSNTLVANEGDEGLFVKWFTMLIIIATIGAIPLSYLAARYWLKDFAFATTIGLASFIVTFVAILVCTLFSIGNQILRTASRNPVKYLR